MNISPISFGKKYISKAPIVETATKTRKMADFVEYEHTLEDYNHLAKTNNDWHDNAGGKNGYIREIVDEFINSCASSTPDSKIRFFGLEDEKGKIQSICEVVVSKTKLDKEMDPNNQNGSAIILYISTNPKSMYGSKSRKYSKAGLSLFNEILKQYKNENICGVALTDVSDGFWKKLSLPIFKSHPYAPSAGLPKKNFDEYIKKFDEVI